METTKILNVKELINGLTIKSAKLDPITLVGNPWNPRKKNEAGHYNNPCVKNMEKDGWNVLARTPVIANVKGIGPNTIIIGHSQVDEACLILESKTVSVAVMESVQKIPCRVIEQELTIEEAKAISADSYLREDGLTYWQLYRVALNLTDVHLGKYLLQGGETAFKADIHDSLCKHNRKYETQESKGFLAPMYRACVLGGEIAKAFEAFTAGEVKEANTPALRKAYDAMKAHLTKNPLELVQARDIAVIEYHATIASRSEEKSEKKSTEKLAEKSKRQEEYIEAKTSLYMTIINSQEIDGTVKTIVKAFMAAKDIQEFIALCK